MKRNLKGICVSFTLLCFVLPLGPTAEAQESASLKYVPSSAFAAVFSQPKAIMSHPSMELLPREIISAMGKQEVGVDPVEISNLILLVDTMTDPNEPPGFGMVVQFDSPQEFSPEFLEEDFDETTLDGKTFYESFDPNFPSILVIDRQTYLAGTEAFLRKMLDARGAQSPLITRIKADPPTDHLNAYVVVEPIRALIKNNLPPAEHVPPPMNAFLELPDLIDGLSFKTNVSDSSASRFTISAKDAEAAKRVDHLVQQGIVVGKQMILAAINEDGGFGDEVLARAMQQYIERVAVHFESLLKPEIDGNQLVIELNQGGNGVATAGILVAMLLPAVQQVREAARRVDAANRIRQLALAAHNYHDANKSLPARANFSPDGKPLLSWRVHILPFIEQGNLYNQFHLDEPWDSEHNIQLLEHMPEAFRNPNVDSDDSTVYLAVSGPGTVFDGQKGMRLGEIIDGTSRTVMFVEADRDQAVPWTKPQDWEFDPNDPWRGVGNLRPAGVNAAFCDGSVQIISRQTDSQTWKELMITNDEGNH